LNKNKKIWRLIDLIKWGETYFKDKNFDNPRSEIEWLLEELLNYKKIDLYLKFEEEIDSGKLFILKSWIKRRVSREPLQYITGKADFYGRSYFVNNKVLIPRPETEILIDAAIKNLLKKKNPFIIDIGTGSGCIGITLAIEIKKSNVLSIDISKDALLIAKNNAENHNIKNIEFLEIDILKNDINKKADLIISNPPYISKNELSTLMPEVKNHEPKISLTDNKDGFTFYERFVYLFPKILKNDGAAIIEVGREDHSIRVLEIFKKNGMKNIKVIKDLNSDNRAIIINNS
tara:strand:+ start:714 stop:1580 length:867 start_codon:yes stop_codon:yes gene_type:complete